MGVRDMSYECTKANTAKVAPMQYLGLACRSKQVPHFAAIDLFSGHASDVEPRLILEEDVPVRCGCVHQQNTL